MCVCVCVCVCKTGRYSAIKRTEFCHLPQCVWTKRVLRLVKWFRQIKATRLRYHLQVESKKLRNVYNKTEADSQVRRTHCGYQREEGGERER